VEHEAAAEHASGGFPPFDQLSDYGLSQIFWLAVTFAVLYFAASTWLLPKIKKAIDEREGAIAKDVAEAAALSGKADAAVKAFEAKIAEAKARARDTAAAAKAEADAKVAAETAKVEAALNVRLGAAETRIADVRTKAMANVAGVAEEAAAAIAEKLTGVKTAPAAVKKAVASVMGG
jgi:F-type H+-transporting ATPase subunit b